MSGNLKVDLNSIQEKAKYDNYWKFAPDTHPSSTSEQSSMGTELKDSEENWKQRNIIAGDLRLTLIEVILQNCLSLVKNLRMAKKIGNIVKLENYWSFALTIIRAVRQDSLWSVQNLRMVRKCFAYFVDLKSFPRLL